MTESALPPASRPEPASPGGAGFVELLERAFGQPETFAATVLPEVRARPEQTLPVLMRVFDSPNVVAKNLVADLFRGPLHDAGRPLLLAELSNGTAERFYWASVILADLQVGEAVPLLVKALSGRPTPTVLAALRALARFDRPEAREAILAFFLTARDEVQLSSSIRILEGLAGFLVPRLLERFAGLDQARQAWVLKFLAETGAPAALEVFSQTLARDPCTLGVFCIRGLGRIGTPAAVAALTQHLGHREWFLRKKVVEALGQAKTVEAIPPLIAALTDAAVQVRGAAIESLSKVGGLAPQLMIEAFDRAPPVQKIGLIRAMGQIGDRAFLPVLVGALQDRSLLFFSLDALGDLGQPEGAEALRPFLTDVEWFNRMNALEALAKLDPPNLADLAQTCLQDPNDMVRNAAARILARARPAS